MPPCIYTPPPGLEEKSYLADYRKAVNKQFGLALKDYHQLQKFSVDRPNDFWLSLWNYLPIKASVQPKRGVDESKRIDEFPTFYDGARLNYAENLLSRTGSDIAVRAISEANLDKPQDVSWDQLRNEVRKYYDAMKAFGLQPGDKVVIIGGSTVKSLAIYLAVASLAGIVASFATDAGERVLLDRVGQLSPKLLFAEPSYGYNGKQHDITGRVQHIWDEVNKPAGAELISTGTSTPKGWTSVQRFLSRGTGSKLEFKQVPFHTPFVVMFSSGTTGTPKGIVHSQGGLVVNGMKEHVLHYNHNKSSVHYHYAGIGWTLWNIMVGALFSGAQIVLYDGSPFYPTAEKLLAAVMATGVTSFGAGPRYFTELQKAGVDAKPYVGKVDKIPSAGALLTESMALWIRESFGYICQISTSGGTELCGNFIHGTQTLPVYAGENAVKCLGMDVDVFTPDGKSAPLGEAGELVCKKPFPNMPAFFLNDPDGKKYRAAYFEGFPGVWTHGDFIKINPETGGLTILGRSDGVLNPSGIRFGSGEIYMVLERHFKGEFVDAIVVGQQRERDQAERVVLFLQFRDGGKMPKGMQERIKEAVSKDLSRRHVPHFMFATEQVPYNVNGKKLEIPLRAVISEGKKSFSKRKFTKEEREQLELYLPYYEIEKVTGEEEKAKL